MLASYEEIWIESKANQAWKYVETILLLKEGLNLF